MTKSTPTAKQRLGAGQKGPTPRKDLIYQYQPLDTTRREIRLFKLAPGKPGNKIVGEIFHVSLDDNLCFDALSYMWGPTRPQYKILIDGDSTLYIGRNLRRALDDIRWQDKPRVLWTDAICINQSDLVEREFQVGLMRKIYSGAQVVCAWLDHNVEPRGDVFDDLQRLGEGVEIDDFHDPAHWYPVADIFRNPYWRRLWIQQELILARKTEIYCRRCVFDGLGLLRFQGKVFRSLEYKLGDFHNPMRELHRYINNGGTPFMGGILTGRNALLREGDAFNRSLDQNQDKVEMLPTRRRAHLMALFLGSADLNMTDPRDRVYGILGLTTEDDEHVVTPDYQASILSVYSQVFRIFLARYKSLIFLCFRRDQEVDVLPSGEKFPTWMPDRAVQWATANASQAHGYSKATDALIDPDSFHLTVRGLMVDVVSFVESQEDLGWRRCPDWLATVEGYCRRLWPQSDEKPLWEKEDVTALFFPWASPARYRSLVLSDKPSAKERRDIIRKLLEAERQVEQNGGIVVSPATGYTPPNTMSNMMWDRCRPLHSTLGLSAFVGTRGGRLGTMLRKNLQVDVADQVWVIFGCPMPLVLRPISGEVARFRLMGPIILPGFMQGEALPPRTEELCGTQIEII